jgi:hypothetical protein
MTEQLAAMPADFDKLNLKIERTVADGQLMESTAGPSPGAGRLNQ